MKRQHFTLTELLVVMAIIMILAGLVFPAVSSSRTTAKAAACLSNQKQVITAIIQSMNANKHHFYSPSHDGAANGADAATVRWSARLYNRKYLPDYQVMRCTEVLFPPVERGGYGDDAFTFGAVHHANTKGFDFRGTKLLKISATEEAAPSQLMFGACSMNVKSQSGGALLDLSTSTEFGDIPYGKLFFAHRGAVNMFFYDGHAAAVLGNETKKEEGNYGEHGKRHLSGLRVSPFPCYMSTSGSAVRFDKDILGIWK